MGGAVNAVVEDVVDTFEEAVDAVSAGTMELGDAISQGLIEPFQVGNLLRDGVVDFKESVDDFHNSFSGEVLAIGENAWNNTKDAVEDITDDISESAKSALSVAQVMIEQSAMVAAVQELGSFTEVIAGMALSLTDNQKELLEEAFNKGVNEFASELENLAKDLTSQINDLVSNYVGVDIEAEYDRLVDELEGVWEMREQIVIVALFAAASYYGGPAGELAMQVVIDEYYGRDSLLDKISRGEVDMETAIVIALAIASEGESTRQLSEAYYTYNAVVEYKNLAEAVLTGDVDDMKELSLEMSLSYAMEFGVSFDVTSSLEGYYDAYEQYEVLGEAIKGARLNSAKVLAESEIDNYFAEKLEGVVEGSELYEEITFQKNRLESLISDDVEELQDVLGEVRDEYAGKSQEKIAEIVSYTDSVSSDLRGQFSEFSNIITEIQNGTITNLEGRFELIASDAVTNFTSIQNTIDNLGYQFTNIQQQISEGVDVLSEEFQINVLKLMGEVIELEDYIDNVESDQISGVDSEVDISSYEELLESYKISADAIQFSIVDRVASAIENSINAYIEAPDDIPDWDSVYLDFIKVKSREAAQELFDSGIITESAINEKVSIISDNFNDIEIIVSGDEESDLVASKDVSSSGAWLFGYGGKDSLTGSVKHDILDGGRGNDVLLGEDGDDRLYGGDGDDTLDGGEGADSLYGGSGIDELSGGAGDDVLFADDSNTSSGDVLFFDTSRWYDHDGVLSNHEVEIADFNGDGLDDMVVVTYNNNYHVSLSTGFGFATTTWLQYGGNGDRDDYERAIADFNGDGRDDIILIGSNNDYHVAISGEGSFGADIWSDFDESLIITDWKIADFNGDGKDDVISISEEEDYYVSLSNGSGFETALWFDNHIFEVIEVEYTEDEENANVDKGLEDETVLEENEVIFNEYGFAIAGWEIADFNGDGKNDIITLSVENDYHVSLSNGSEFETSLWHSSDDSFDISSWKIADFDGDGKDDVISVTTENDYYVSLASSDGGFVTSLWSDNDSILSGIEDWKIADFNNDGSSDIIAVDQNNNFYVSLSDGMSFATNKWLDHGSYINTYGDSYNSSYEWDISDFNGDGYDDVIVAGASNDYYVSLSHGWGFVTSMWLNHGDDLGSHEWRIADFDNDGISDLLVANSTNDYYVSITTGSLANDTLDGGADNDLLVGGFGSDQFDGGEGDDTLSYYSAAGGVEASLLNGSATNGDSGSDILYNIENLEGSDYEDTLIGDGNANQLDGLEGDDILEGGYGIDRLYGGVGDDTLKGENDGDVLYGEEGDDLLEGGKGVDVIYGGEGKDTLSYFSSDEGVKVSLYDETAEYGDAEGDVFSEIEHVTGSEYDDTIVGDLLDNRLEGLEGYDYLEGGSGNDTLEGGGDDDFLEGGIGADILVGGVGNDTLSYSNSDEGVEVWLYNGTAKYGDAEGDVFSEVEHVVGSEYNDTLVGDSLDNKIEGLGGDDCLYGWTGDTTLDGGKGNDTLIAWSGNDTLYGGYGNDSLYGGSEGDILNGEEGDDTVVGWFGDDVLDGGSGDDVLDGGSGNDTLEGGGDDDFLEGGSGDDVLDGGSGDDILEGGSGSDVIAGGIGEDTLSYFSSSTKIKVNLFSGTAEYGDAEGDIFSGIEHVEGTVYHDNITGDSLDNKLKGFEGSDILYGGSGNDTLDGGEGNDILEGGRGADILVGGTGINTLSYYNSDEGVEIRLYDGTAKYGDAEGDVYSEIKHIRGSGHNDTLVGDSLSNTLKGFGGNDSMYGGSGRDTLYGGSGNDILYAGSDNGLVFIFLVDDVLYGEDGDDVLYGGKGTDYLYGGIGEDTLSYYFSDEGVEINLHYGTAEHGYAERDVYSGIEHVEGSQYNDTLIGDSLDNKLEGSAGNDLIEGRDGNDRLKGGDGSDTLYGGSENDILYAGSGDFNRLYGEEGEDTLYVEGGKSNILDGGVDNDTLYGGSFGENTLRGGEGDDFIVAGKASEWLNGGTISFSWSPGVFTPLISGNDTVSYRNSDSGVLVNLETRTAENGYADGDTLINVENLEGSEFDDSLTGDSNDNIFEGLGGDDFLVGGLGNDTLDGGEGNDTVSYYNYHEGIKIDLDEGDISTDDVLYNVEGVYGSRYNDTLIGGDSHNHLVGLQGNDSLEGGSGDDYLEGGTGADVLNGGDGEDTISYSTSGMGVEVDLYHGSGRYGDAEGDSISKIEHVLASEYGDIITGDLLSNKLEGLGGDDYLYGGSGNDTLEGGNGNDLLDGESGDDLVFAGDGDDTLYGGSGNDTLHGELGKDYLYGGSGNDYVDGSTGNDYVYGGEGDDTLHGGNDNDTLRGGLGNDELEGDLGSDVIHGEEGNDVIWGEEGFDLIYGGEGNDLVFAGFDNDTVYGGDDDDVLYGESGYDYLDGGAGNDLLYGGDNNDTLLGGIGDDTLRGYNDNDVVYGGIGNDHIEGNSGSDILYGESGNDLIFGQVGNDQLFGGEGDDALLGGNDDDTLKGDEGDDGLYGEYGDDHLEGGIGDDYLDGGYGNDLLYGESGDDLVFAGDGDDTLYGGFGNDTLHGELGTDYLYGDSGNDYVDGSTGNDYVYGGEGDDTLHGGNDNDTLYGGLGNDELEGDLGSDVIYGEEGSDKIWGEEGSDLVFAGLDNDTVYGGDDDDVLYGEQGYDYLDGGTGNDLLYGGDNNDTLLGGIGDDTLRGYNDNDVVYGGIGNDHIEGNSGSDILYGESGNDLIFGQIGKDQLFGGEGDDALLGGNDNDTLIGGKGNDGLYGEYGNDRLVGGDGSDVLYGGYESDLFDYNSLSDSTDSSMDTIMDFEVGLDLIDLSDIEEIDEFSNLSISYSGGNTYVEDLNSNFIIELVGDIILSEDDFIIS